MNLVRLKISSNIINIVLLALLVIFYGLFIYSNRQKLFMKFDKSLIDKYMISQDILDTENSIKNRIFISDEDIYLASGYLYATGSNPVSYNFQHPPFIKYLFGLSSYFFNLPLLPNIIFSALLILEIIILSKHLYNNYLIGMVGSLLLLADPVFKEVTIYALLDLGQIVFILGFLIVAFFYPLKYIFRGLLLGLAFVSKFYTPVFIFLIITYIFDYLNRKINLKGELFTLIVAGFTFYLVYWNAWPYNIFYHQVKIFKFMIDHNHAINWGEVLKVFFGGYIVWPILFIINLFMLFYQKVKLTEKFIYLLPVLFLTIMTFQIPFTRYFIIILPFMYLIASRFIYLKFIHE